MDEASLFAFAVLCGRCQFPQAYCEKQRSCGTMAKGSGGCRLLTVISEMI